MFYLKCSVVNRKLACQEIGPNIWISRENRTRLQVIDILRLSGSKITVINMFKKIGVQMDDSTRGICIQVSNGNPRIKKYKLRI